MQYFGIGFLVLIFLEIMSIVWVADWLGGGWTLFLMALSFIGGIFMLRHTGISGLLLAGAAVRSGQNISLYQMLWPIRYTAAAVFLLSPGFISTTVALLLLIPFKGNAAVSSTQSFQSRQTYSSAKDNEDIIEGEYTVTRTSKADKPQDYIEHKPD
ncbi:TPA: FxsA family protein [Neisseria subflava]|uniref:FxsA family protein n=1 Tax=unclassified Neisseria TaxID=2623750 RepID=UPI0035F76BB7